MADANQETPKCAETIYKSEGGWGRRHNCERRAGHGPEGRYCSQHAEKYASGATVTWYQVTAYGDYSCQITPVDVLKETASTLLIKGANRSYRENKDGVTYKYFSQLGDAIDFYRNRVTVLRKRADQFEEAINKLEAGHLDHERKKDGP